jgi:hypothetical protein
MSEFNNNNEAPVYQGPIPAANLGLQHLEAVQRQTAGAGGHDDDDGDVAFIARNARNKATITTNPYLPCDDHDPNPGLGYSGGTHEDFAEK